MTLRVGEIARPLEIRLRQFEISLRGTQLRLLGRSIELQQDVAFFHRRAGLRTDLRDRARELRADFRALHRRD